MRLRPLRRAAGSWSAIGADTGIPLLKALSSEVPEQRCPRLWRQRVRMDGEKVIAQGGGEDRGERVRPVLPGAVLLVVPLQSYEETQRSSVSVGLTAITL